jgi:hypothetical protein
MTDKTSLPNCRLCHKVIPRDPFELAIIMTQCNFAEDVVVEKLDHKVHYWCAVKAMMKIKDALAEMEEILR